MIMTQRRIAPALSKVEIRAAQSKINCEGQRTLSATHTVDGAKPARQLVLESVLSGVQDEQEPSAAAIECDDADAMCDDLRATSTSEVQTLAERRTGRWCRTSTATIPAVMMTRRHIAPVLSKVDARAALSKIEHQRTLSAIRAMNGAKPRHTTTQWDLAVGKLVRPHVHETVLRDGHTGGGGVRVRVLVLTTDRTGRAAEVI